MQVYQPQMKSIKDKFPKEFLNNEAIGKQYKTIKKEINKDDLIYKISYKKVLRHLQQYDFLKKVSWILMPKNYSVEPTDPIYVKNYDCYPLLSTLKRN